MIKNYAIDNKTLIFFYKIIGGTVIKETNELKDVYVEFKVNYKHEIPTEKEIMEEVSDMVFEKIKENISGYSILPCTKEEYDANVDRSKLIENNN
jgi:hypothetical protein